MIWFLYHCVHLWYARCTRSGHWSTQTQKCSAEMSAPMQDHMDDVVTKIQAQILVFQKRYKAIQPQYCIANCSNERLWRLSSCENAPTQHLITIIFIRIDQLHLVVFLFQCWKDAGTTRCSHVSTVHVISCIYTVFICSTVCGTVAIKLLRYSSMVHSYSDLPCTILFL